MIPPGEYSTAPAACQVCPVPGRGPFPDGRSLRRSPPALRPLFPVKHGLLPSPPGSRSFRRPLPVQPHRVPGSPPDVSHETSAPDLFRAAGRLFQRRTETAPDESASLQALAAGRGSSSRRGPQLLSASCSLPGCGTRPGQGRKNCRPAGDNKRSFLPHHGPCGGTASSVTEEEAGPPRGSSGSERGGGRSGGLSDLSPPPLPRSPRALFPSPPLPPASFAFSAGQIGGTAAAPLFPVKQRDRQFPAVEDDFLFSRLSRSFPLRSCRRHTNGRERRRSRFFPGCSRRRGLTSGAEMRQGIGTHGACMDGRDAPFPGLRKTVPDLLPRRLPWLSG